MNVMGGQRVLASTSGTTAPISTCGPNGSDLWASRQLESCLRSYGLFESAAETERRKNVLSRLNQIVQKWVREVSAKKMPKQSAQLMAGKIFTFGSYRLGVHTKGADIDTLVVAPRHVQRSDFFDTFPKMLSQIPNCEYVRAVRQAFVPVIKTKIEGIEVDVVFAKLALNNIPQDLDLSDGSLLKNIDEKTVLSLNGSRVADDILRLVPNRESFCLALRAVKLWAKRRGIYSNVLGFFGGASWTLLVAHTCQLYPRASAATLLQKFFELFRQWEWSKPVLLRRNSDDDPSLGFTVWDPQKNGRDRHHLMPIITPSYPQRNSTYNVSKSTKTIIINELIRGSQIINNIISGDVPWDSLFESDENFFIKYEHFIVLLVSPDAQWMGLVESKIRILVQKLERHTCIRLAHVNPKCFTGSRTHTSLVLRSRTVCAPKDNAKTQTIMWFIGIEFNKGQGINVDLTRDFQSFVQMVTNVGKSGNFFKPEMTCDTKRVNWKELENYLPTEVFKTMETAKSAKICGKRGLEYTNSSPKKGKTALKTQLIQVYKVN
ncbi:unnamed protein product [Medioppia subpectinata]|uniref:Poly(A) polymerase n=1 Tax=Medioppia subpectinata TaxID=1979941 RepID=A0A7R9KCN9_9ACAR|nr:unnamed protein product [Medioppia subpectinata]CAG2100763.1 unnamed protein product [Medioppia subpectinata]